MINSHGGEVPIRYTGLFGRGRMLNIRILIAHFQNKPPRLLMCQVMILLAYLLIYFQENN